MPINYNQQFEEPRKNILGQYNFDDPEGNQPFKDRSLQAQSGIGPTGMSPNPQQFGGISPSTNMITSSPNIPQPNPQLMTNAGQLPIGGNFTPPPNLMTNSQLPTPPLNNMNISPNPPPMNTQNSAPNLMTSSGQLPATNSLMNRKRLSSFGGIT